MNPTPPPANSEAVQAALGFAESDNQTGYRFCDIKPWGMSPWDFSLPILAAEVRKLQEALAEKESQITAANKRIEELDRQTRYAWERHAEKDRAYGAMIKERDRLLEALANYVNADDWTKQLEANALEVISAIYSREVAQAALATPGDAADHQSTAPEDKGADSCKKNDPVFLTEQQPGDAASLSALYSSFCEDEMSSEQLAAARKKYDDYVQRTLKPQPQAGDAPREL